MPAVAAQELHPGENRALRELYAYARALVAHWSALGERIGPRTSTGEALLKGAAAARELIAELKPLTAGYGLHGKPAAQGAGISIARRTDIRDRFLERGQAVRFAVEDAVHLTVLLGYLARVAESRGDTRLKEFHSGWERKLRRHESAARKAATEEGSDPDAAIEPLHTSALGRAAHGVGYAIGSAGEWFDRRAASRGQV